MYYTFIFGFVQFTFENKTIVGLYNLVLILFFFENIQSKSSQRLIKNVIRVKRHHQWWNSEPL